MLISISLNENQAKWLESQMGCKPTPQSLKKWLASGNSLAGMPEDLPRGGYRPRKNKAQKKGLV